MTKLTRDQERVLDVARLGKAWDHLQATAAILRSVNGAEDLLHGVQRMASAVARQRHELQQRSDPEPGGAA